MTIMVSQPTNEDRANALLVLIAQGVDVRHPIFEALLPKSRPWLRDWRIERVKRASPERKLERALWAVTADGWYWGLG